MRAGLSRAEAAQRMRTPQRVVARLESSRQPPSLRTMQRDAQAVDAAAASSISLETFLGHCMTRWRRSATRRAGGREALFPGARRGNRTPTT